MSFTSINLGLRDLLRDPVRRHEFFKAITQDDIAAQIRDLRKERRLTQVAFAERADMKQSAVSRIEQAEYSSWTLTTLFRAAAALDARLRVIFQPMEEAVREYENLEGNKDEPVREEENSAARAFNKMGRGQNEDPLNLKKDPLQRRPKIKSIYDQEKRDHDRGRTPYPQAPTA